MTPDAENLEDLRDRLRVLEKENELLAERAEDISLLGLVAEQTGTETDPRELLTSVLERVCILKAIPYGAYLEPEGARLRPVAIYHLRRSESAEEDQFHPREATPWALDRAMVLGPEGLGRWF